MIETALITDPENMTAAWLTNVLKDNGFSAEVTGFTAASIGTGQVGENVRFTLSGSGDLPATVVGKFASPDPVSRQTGIDLLNYKKEVHFYQHLQKRVNIQTPNILFTDIDPETHEFIILMEDLAPGVQGDQLAGCGVTEAELAMVQLAHLHGPLWADTSIIDGEIITDRSDAPATMGEFYNGLMPGFLARYDDRLTAEEKDVVQQVGAAMERYVGGYEGERTLIHIDYRLDNMMFGGPYPLAVVDWQSFAFDCALNDVSYFMGTSVRGEERAGAEEQLLKGYFATLGQYNTSLTWDECWHYYRHYAPAGLIMAVIASMIVGETDRGNDMFMAMAKRSARMSIELDAIGAINR